MSAFVGSGEITAAWLGSTALSAIHVGATQIWPAAAGGTWTPADAGATQPRFWLDAAEGVTGTTAVSSWAGRTDGKTAVTFNSTFGTIALDTSGATPRLVFTSAYMTSTDHSLQSLSSYYMVIDIGTSPIATNRIFGGPNNARHQLNHDSDTHDFTAFAGDANNFTRVNLPDPTGDIVVVAEFSGAGSLLQVDGGRLSDTGDPGVMTPTTVYLGASTNNPTGTPFTGSFREFIAYDGALSEAEREQVEGYLAHKHGLAANLPAAHSYKSAAP